MNQLIVFLLLYLNNDRCYNFDKFKFNLTIDWFIIFLEHLKIFIYLRNLKNLKKKNDKIIIESNLNLNYSVFFVQFDETCLLEGEIINFMTYLIIYIVFIFLKKKKLI